jgi:hypothetical protein
MDTLPMRAASGVDTENWDPYEIAAGAEPITGLGPLNK